MHEQTTATMLLLSRQVIIFFSGKAGHPRPTADATDRGMRSGHGTCWTFLRQTTELMSTYTGEWANDVRSGRGIVRNFESAVFFLSL
jgi:hypothetical protein